MFLKMNVKTDCQTAYRYRLVEIREERREEDYQPGT